MLPTGAVRAPRVTGREVEIIRLIALRKSNKAIGQALGISPRTVTTHLSNIYRELAISSRGELACQASDLLSAERSQTSPIPFAAGNQPCDTSFSVDCPRAFSSVNMTRASGQTMKVGDT